MGFIQFKKVVQYTQLESIRLWNVRFVSIRLNRHESQFKDTGIWFARDFVALMGFGVGLKMLRFVSIQSNRTAQPNNKAQNKTKWFRQTENGLAHDAEIDQSNVEWFSVNTNSAAFREIDQSNVE